MSINRIPNYRTAQEGAMKPDLVSPASKRMDLKQAVIGKIFNRLVFTHRFTTPARRSNGHLLAMSRIRPMAVWMLSTGSAAFHPLSQMFFPLPALNCSWSHAGMSSLPYGSNLKSPYQDDAPHLAVPPPLHVRIILGQHSPGTGYPPPGVHNHSGGFIMTKNLLFFKNNIDVFRPD
jgi:hypothetical protein